MTWNVIFVFSLKEKGCGNCCCFLGGVWCNTSFLQCPSQKSSSETTVHIVYALFKHDAGVQELAHVILLMLNVLFNLCRSAMHGMQLCVPWLLGLWLSGMPKLHASQLKAHLKCDSGHMKSIFSWCGMGITYKANAALKTKFNNFFHCKTCEYINGFLYWTHLFLM